MSSQRRQSKSPSSSKPRLSRWSRTRLMCEPLEHRLAPATIAWDGGPTGTGTNWHTPANWVGDTLPGASDVATVGGAFAGVTITSASDVTVDSVGSSATLQIDGGTFTVQSASSSSKLTLNGGAIAGDGDFTITNVFNWTGGDLAAGIGKTILAASANGTISGANSKTVSRTLENSGSLDYTGSNLQFGFGPGEAGVIANLAGAILNATGPGDFLQLNAGSHAINNAGTFNRSGTQGTSVDVPFNNSGTVNVTAGLLGLEGGGTQTGTFNVLASGATLRLNGGQTLAVGSSVAGSGRAEFSTGTATVDGTLTVDTTRVVGGTLNVNSSISVSKLELMSGALGGAGVLTVTSTLTWSGGDMAAGTGTTVLGATATGTLSDTNTKSLSRTFDIQGTLTYTGSNFGFGLNAGDVGVLNVLSGGLMNVVGPNSVTALNPGSHSINNTGALNHFGAGTTSITGVSLNNDGVMNITAGTLSLGADGSHDGSFQVNAGAFLNLSGGTHVLTATSSVTGGGTLRLLTPTTIEGTLPVSAVEISSAVTINSNVSTPAVSLLSGSVDGTGVATVTSAFTWSAGDMAASTGKIVVDVGATGTLIGLGSKTLSRTLENAGTLNYNGSNLTFGFAPGQSGVLSNLAGGQLIVNGDSDFTVANAGTHSIINAGTFRKASGTDVTTVGVPLTTTGLLETLSGNINTTDTLTLSGTVTATGGQVVITGGGSFVGAFAISSGTVSISSNTVTLQNGATGTGAGLLILSGGTLNVNTGDSASLARLTQRRGSTAGGGTLTITSALTWAAAPMTGGGKTVVAPGATGNLSGTGNKLLGRTLENQGTLTYSGVGLQFGFGGFDGVLSNLSGGVLNLNGDGDMTVFIAGSHLFDNAGTANRSGTGTTSIEIPANNDGTINVNDGTLTFEADGTHTGAFTVSSGDTLRFNAGTHSLSSTSSISGAGTVQFFSPSITVDGSLSASSVQVTGTVVINTNASISTLAFDSGSLGGSGIVTVNTAFTWQSGDLAAGTGTLALASTATGTIIGAGNKWLSRTLENSGTLSYTGSNFLFGFGAGQAGVLSNLSGGVFNATGDGDLVVWTAGSHAVNNSGTMNRSGAGATNVGMPFNNDGSLNITAGTLSADAGGTHTGSFSIGAGTTLRLNGTHSFGGTTTVAGSGTVELTGGTATMDGSLTTSTTRVVNGTLNVNGAATVGTLDQTGGSVGGSGVIDVTATFTWSAGNQAASTGKTVIAAAATGTISGTSNKWLSRTLENAGILSYTGSNLLFGFGAGQAGVLSNLAGGTLNATGGGDLLVANAGAHAVQNAGTFNRSGSGATDIAVSFDNSGAVNVTAGTLNVNAGGTSTGSFAVGGGSILRFGGGSQVLSASASINGGGTLQIAGGTTTVDGTLGMNALDVSAAIDINSSPSITVVTLSAGSLGGSGTVTVTGTLTWTGGNMAAGTGMTVLAAGANGAISGAGSKWLSRTFENSGTLDYNGSNLGFGFGPGEAGVLSNMVGGVFTADGDGDFSVANAGSHAITNAGTFNRTGAGTTQVATGIQFTTSGTVELQAGTLDVVDGYTQTAGNTILNSGTTLAAGSDVDISGSLRGSGTINANLINGGQVRPGGAGAAGTITVTGNYTQTAAGTLVIELGGTAPGTFDVLAVGGSVTLDGILNVSLINSFNPALGDNFSVLTFASRTGDFATMNGLNIGGGKELDPVYSATDLTLSTVTAGPAPDTDNGPSNTDIVPAERDSRPHRSHRVLNVLRPEELDGI